MRVDGSVEARIYRTDGSGKYDVYPIKNVYLSDVQYIRDNNLILSIEDLGYTMAVYLRDQDDDGCENELLELAFDKPCEDVIRSLVEKHKKRNI